MKIDSAPIKALKDHIGLLDLSISEIAERISNDTKFCQDLRDQRDGCRLAVEILESEKSVAASD